MFNPLFYQPPNLTNPCPNVWWSCWKDIPHVYTIWLFNIAMENDPFIDGLPIKNGGSFHGYVSLPEGISLVKHISNCIISPIQWSENHAGRQDAGHGLRAASEKDVHAGAGKDLELTGVYIYILYNVHTIMYNTNVCMYKYVYIYIIIYIYSICIHIYICVYIYIHCIYCMTVIAMTCNDMWQMIINNVVIMMKNNSYIDIYIYTIITSIYTILPQIQPQFGHFNLGRFAQIDKPWCGAPRGQRASGPFFLLEIDGDRFGTGFHDVQMKVYKRGYVI